MDLNDKMIPIEWEIQPKDTKDGTVDQVPDIMECVTKQKHRDCVQKLLFDWLAVRKYEKQYIMINHQNVLFRPC